jgi:hypothetical protein
MPARLSCACLDCKKVPLDVREALTNVIQVAVRQDNTATGRVVAVHLIQAGELTLLHSLFKSFVSLALEVCFGNGLWYLMHVHAISETVSSRETFPTPSTCRHDDSRAPIPIHSRWVGQSRGEKSAMDSKAPMISACH